MGVGVCVYVCRRGGEGGAMMLKILGVLSASIFPTSWEDEKEGEGALTSCTRVCVSLLVYSAVCGSLCVCLLICPASVRVGTSVYMYTFARRTTQTIVNSCLVALNLC